jgi:hypothetical protein
MNFGYAVLRKPRRTGRRHNLTSVIKKRVADYEEGSPDMDSPTEAVRGRTRDAEAQLSAAVTAKIEDGNIKAAIRMLCSEEKPAVDIEAAFLKLQERHPPAPADRHPFPDPGSTTPIQATEDEVLRAIRTFPAGSAGGPDGIRPQHVLDMVGCRETGAILLTSLTAFVNTLLEGNCPQTVAPILFGGNLIAIEKKNGGIRPIAIGYTWRRIAAKCANSHATSALADYLSPIQLGVGVPGGCEAAVHATRRYIESMPAGHCVVKLDFSNAFNSLHRDTMLKEASEKSPGVYRFLHLAYSQPSVLTYKGRSILSQEGLQQGDPLGASQFCSAIQPLLSSLGAPLVLGLMDDLTLGGEEKQVAADVQLVRQKGAEIGLQLNINKCEFINCTAASDEPIFQGFIHLVPSGATLLGAPLTTGAAMDEALLSRCSDLSRAAERLKAISAHDALLILRSSLSAPKLLYTIRSSPCAGHPALGAFDELLRGCVSNITNTDLTDTQWLQASLPVANGGLGIRRVASLAPSAFLASAAGTRDLQERILQRCPSPSDPRVDEVFSQWKASLGSPCPVVLNITKQHAWDKPCVSADVANLMEVLTDPRDRARLLAVSAPHGGAWLHALPISACGLRLDNEAIRVAVGLRLGTKLCEPHRCPCGAEVDTTGTHGLACRRSSGRSVRHHQINDMIWRALQRAGVPSVKEPAGLARTDGKRPDGLTLIPWRVGKCLTWDVTVTDTLAESYVNVTSMRQGGAAEGAAERKRDKYRDLTNTYLFVPIALETLGPISLEATDFLNGLGHRLSVCTGDDRETAFLYQRLSIAIQRFNSVAFLGTFETCVDADF